MPTDRHARCGKLSGFPGTEGPRVGSEPADDGSPYAEAPGALLCFYASILTAWLRAESPHLTSALSACVSR